MTRGSCAIEVVVGGQFGSEAKGTVAARLVKTGLGGYESVGGMRVGGPNAGHTVINDEGVKFAFRQLPVAAAFNGANCYIAPGSEIDISVLYDEIEQVEAAGYSLEGRLFVASSATLLTPAHIEQEAAADLNARIGSTAKGVGAARSSRIMREASTFGDWAEKTNDLGPVQVMTDLHMADTALFTEGRLVIEGTQGYGLGLHTNYYPSCTSGDCRAIDFLAQAGISPWDPMVATIRPWVVFRVNPIRVAGNSGPMANETSWEELGVPAEYTTVTKKQRRVGTWDPALARMALAANGSAVRVALTMVDQLFPREGDVPGAATGDLLEAADEAPALRDIIRDLGAVHHWSWGPQLRDGAYGAWRCR